MRIMDVMEEIFNLAGSLICHQLPSRSLYAGAMKLPVCARDMGIYSGIFISALYLAFARRLKARKPPGITAAVILCLMMLPMMADGSLSYMGLIKTNNAARLYTGLFFGVPLPFLLVPAAHFKAEAECGMTAGEKAAGEKAASEKAENEKAVLKSAAELLPLGGAGILLCRLLLEGLVPYAAAGSIFVAGLLFLLSRLSYTVIARTWQLEGKRLFLPTLAGTVIALAALYVLSTLVLSPIMDYLIETGGTGQ